jgi:hypothetical protein
MLGGEMATDFFAGGEGLEPVQTLVPIAANCSKNPEVTNAAAGTFLHEGREAAVRCTGQSDITHVEKPTSITL